MCSAVTRAHVAQQVQSDGKLVLQPKPGATTPAACISGQPAGVGICVEFDWGLKCAAADVASGGVRTCTSDGGCAAAEICYGGVFAFSPRTVAHASSKVCSTHARSSHCGADCPVVYAVA